MKSRNDPRHQKRKQIFKKLFAWQFNTQEKLPASVLEITKSAPKLDKEIQEAAPLWPIDRINQIDLAILRLAIFELIIKRQQPFKVIVDEAIELAKEFGSDDSPKFINGALGKVIEKHHLDR